MKKIMNFLWAVPMIAMVSCQDEIAENPVIPAQTGDEITFGSSLTDVDVQTRTIYGDEPIDNAYPVYWEMGDQVAIYCPEAAQGTLVNYKITPDQNNPTTSSAVTKVNSTQAGLQWGTEEVHHFSAFYPADRIIGIEDGRLTAEIPVSQDPVRWESKSNEQGGTTYTGIANTDYAFMWAYGTHSKSDGGDVNLLFHPWVTILDVEITGPSNGEIKMSSIQIRSTSGETLNGEFQINFTDVEQGTNPDATPTYIQSGNPNATRSQITIQLYDQSLNNGQGDFITLGQNDKIVVRFYLLPKDNNYDTSARTDLQVRLTPYNSAVLTRTLNAQGGTQTGGILAHKVNKVILPPVNEAGPNYWMSSLDPNIYVTELSLPGSKMSYQTAANGANVVYQDLSIAEQVQNGIRAFQIQTASTNNHGLFDSGDAEDQILYMTVGGTKTNTRFSTVVAEIANGLKEAANVGRNQEYAFILLTPAESECDSYGGLLGFQVPGALAWMDAIKNDLAMMAQSPDTYRLYTDEITPNTTISDVAGHIIIKVNVNTTAMANHLTTTDQIPALFAQWGAVDDVITDFTETDPYAINEMRWGTSNLSTTATLSWFYHEATAVGYNNADAGAYGETYDQKIANIEDMWNRSINYYENNSDHSMWFLNDLGGSYVGGSYGGNESNNGINAWTQVVGPYATRLLQNRDEDATLGIVLINFANPDNQYSGNLIQTIINNNFNFQLRTAGSGQAENYNATYSNGGNAIGWE